MSIGDDEIRDLFEAAKLVLSGDKLGEAREDIRAFEKWIAPLLAVKTEGVEPTLYNFSGTNRLREDVAIARVDNHKFYRAASNFEEGFYRVPPILE
ncbi:MAG: hypothetical protein GX887_02220 [Firmicutes bacterium]|nr:hypothetical protein [Bacillota bacterium]